MSEERLKRLLSPGLENRFESVQSAAKHFKSDSTSQPSEEAERITVLEPQCNDAVCESLFLDSDDDWTGNTHFIQELYTLDLSKWQRCKVLSVERCPNQSLLVILEEKRNKEKAKCYLYYPWNTLDNIVPGLIVSVQAIQDHDNAGHFKVSCEDGLFVTDPDLLVSGTTVVGSLYCRRRGVLQEIFRMVDSESQEMHVGTLAHTIFQRCLTDDHCNSLEDVRRIAETCLTSRKMVSTLYSYKTNATEALKILDPYVKETALFLERYVHNRKACKLTVGESKKRNEKEALMIHKINDIEENIWCHELGIKGRIDATVSVTCQSNPPKMSNEQPYEVMPLELKTGRASYSFEHTGQLVLYEMMMNLVGHRVNSGLLVYLRDGKCNRMMGNRNTRRDLIMLRNEIAHYADRWMSPDVSNRMKGQNPLPMIPVLPEPIDNERACAKCQHNTVCTVMAKREDKPNTHTERHGLSIIADETSGHLTNHDIDYFIRWTGIIYLEQKEATKDYTARKLWTKEPKERAQRGWCMTGLSLKSPVRMIDDSFFHSFIKEPQFSSLGSNKMEDWNNEACHGFKGGDYVICSTNARIAVAAGHIVSCVGHELVVTLERDLSVNYSGETFHLDRSESYNSGRFNLTNLAMLLGKTEEAKRCRRIIIDQEKPTFTDGILLKSKIPEAKQILKNLNRHQKHATLKAASTESYCLLKGLPGTGKTQTIVGLIRILLALGESVLLTSNTHSAVDNVLKRLVQYDGLNFIRLGSLERIDPAIRQFSATVLSEQCDTPEQLADLYNQFPIVAVTCQGASHPLILQRTFDYCIVDEATQVFQSSIIRPLLRSKRFLLVGDPEQLPPVVTSHEARSVGASESLFHRLDQEGSFCILPTQYRMNRVLTKLANDFTYDGKLICGNDIVANASLRLPQLSTLRQFYEVERWLLKTVSNQIDLSAVVLDTGNTFDLNLTYRLSNMNISEEKERTKMNCTNIAEVAITVYVCTALLRAGVESTSIGVMAPFRAQVDLIREYLSKLLPKHTPFWLPETSTLSMPAANLHDQLNDACDIEVNTVDQFQGKDKKLIIYSCTRSVDPNRVVKADDGLLEILHDKRRLTVAITRAKEKLIIIGDRTCLQAYKPFSKLFEVTHKAASIKIVDKKDGFEWNNILDVLNSTTD